MKMNLKIFVAVSTACDTIYHHTHDLSRVSPTPRPTPKAIASITIAASNAQNQANGMPHIRFLLERSPDGGW